MITVGETDGQKDLEGHGDRISISEIMTIVTNGTPPTVFNALSGNVNRKAQTEFISGNRVQFSIQNVK